MATFTSWFEDAAQLGEVDWDIVYAQWWNDRPEDNDRQRRKQAEFLVWQQLPWPLIDEIVVINTLTQALVQQVLSQFPQQHQPPVRVHRGWYY